MIKSFKHKGLEQFFVKDLSKWLDARDLPRIERILDRLDAALSPRDMDIPGWRLHELQANRKGTWSLYLRKNRRITFQFIEGDAHHVNLEDYH